MTHDGLVNLIAMKYVHGDPEGVQVNTRASGK